MQIEPKFWRVEEWIQDNYGKHINEVSYFDREQEAKDRALETAKRWIKNEEAEENDSITVSDAEGRIVYNLCIQDKEDGFVVVEC